MGFGAPVRAGFWVSGSGPETRARPPRATRMWDFYRHEIERRRTTAGTAPAQRRCDVCALMHALHMHAPTHTARPHGLHTHPHTGVNPRHAHGIFTAIRPGGNER